MESVAANSAEEQKTIFTLAGETNVTTTTDSYGLSDKTGGPQEGTTLSSILSGAGGNDMLNRGSQQEPRVADCAPSVADMEELLTNIRLSNSDMFSDDSSLNNYFTGYSRPESAATNSAGAWPDNSLNNPRNAETMDTFDFLVKSLWSANKYVSMLTGEQLSMLRSIRPSLLYTFLQEVAKARSDRRSRRTLPNECAFCKNNGENEECYSTHALKDWRGRVLCPVLRAFCCPRCGATGDRAHTIKYCPEPAGADSGLSSRRRVPPSTSLLMGGGAGGGAGGAGSRPHAASPATTPNNTFSYSALWSNFNMN